MTAPLLPLQRALIRTRTAMSFLHMGLMDDAEAELTQLIDLLQSCIPEEKEELPDPRQLTIPWSDIQDRMP